MSLQYRDAIGHWETTSALSAGAQKFYEELKAQIGRARKHGAPHVEINAGDLHRRVGGYPGPTHQMPLCCDAMYFAQQLNDEIVVAPKRGKGASLTIRYKLPR
jgi:5-methylcytosine-specific restriction protein A